MGWSVSYDLKRATPLSEAERAALEQHVKKYARIKWEVEKYELRFPEPGDRGEIVAGGITKMPARTGHRNWASLLKALTELRGMIDGATCEIWDDYEAVSWDESRKCYSIGAAGGGDFDGFDDNVYRPDTRATWYVLDRIEKSDPHCLAFNANKKHPPNFEVLRGTAKLVAHVDARGSVKSKVDSTTLTAFDAGGAVLQSKEIAQTVGKMELQPGVMERLDQLELTARTSTPITSRAVATFTCEPIVADGPVTLVAGDTSELFPHVVLTLTCERAAEPSALWFELDGRGPRVPPGHPLEISVITFTETGMELERATTTGSFADCHSFAMPIAPEQVARVRRIEVRVTGTLVLEGRVARWKLAIGGRP